MACCDGTPLTSPDLETLRQLVGDFCEHVRADAHTPLDQPLARFRAEAERARSGGFSTITAWLGDSLTESYEPTKRGYRWINRLAHRLNARGAHSAGGGTGAVVLYVPTATGTFSTTAAGDWPGDQAPWTYTGTATGLVDRGADLHAVQLAAGATASLAFFGDTANLYWTRTPTGPTGAPVTIDGVAAGTINAQGAEAAGQAAAFGTIGDYGPHTVQVTASGAPLVLEGAVVHDGTRFGFGQAFDNVMTFAFGHAGFSTQEFVDNDRWPASLASVAGAASLVGIALGANDLLAGRTPGQYRANLLAIMAKLDAAIAAAGITTVPGYLLVQMPGLGAGYLDAAWDAACEFGEGRAGVLDLAALLPDGGADWGTFDAGNGHPNDGGQLWIADQLATVLNGRAGLALPQMRPGGPVIEASDEPTARSQWAASFGFTAGQTYDTTTADSTVRERRHRVWLEPGTYVARVRYEQITTTGGTVEVLVGNTSAGSVATTGTTGTLGETQLGTTVTVDSPGWYPVTIRKTGASAAALRFVRLHLRKT